MRAFKLILAVVALLIIAAFGSIAWLGATESGTRWLITELLYRVPVEIEVDGLQGTLVDGLDADSVEILLPVARIRIKDVSLAWRPADLVAGRVVLNKVDIHELTVDLVEESEPTESDLDPLFWLQLPVDIGVQRGHVDYLRVVAAEFEQLNLAGALGWGRLNVNQATARIAGVDLQLAGRLSGAAPGDLNAELQWAWPAMGYSGGGTFDGDIETLRFSHRAQLPETVNLTGEISSLFYRPTMTGAATWDVFTVPGGQPLAVNRGEGTFETDFVRVRVASRAALKFAELPEMPAQIEALVSLDGITIDRYQLDAFDGSLAGQGELSFKDGLSGRLDVAGTDIALAYLLPEYPGHLGFDAKLNFQNATDIDINVARFAGELYSQPLAGRAQLTVRDAGITAVDGEIKLANNSLAGKLQLLPALSGTATINVAELADIWPAAHGRVVGDVSVAGSIERPRLKINGVASDLSYAGLAVTEVTTAVTYAHGKEVSVSLAADGLRYGGIDLGELRTDVAGTPLQHTTQLSLSGGVVAVELDAAGAWDGVQLRQRILSAQIQPRDFGAWKLADEPELVVANASVRLDRHCWKQDSASLCVGESIASQQLTSASFQLQRLPLVTLNPLLPDEFKLVGTADASGQLRLDSNGPRGRIRWQQGETVLAYQLDDDILETRISQLNVSLDSDDKAATLDALILGPDGLKLKAAGSVTQPLNDDSNLSGELTGLLPDISLLRPLLLRVTDTGEMAGVGRANLRISGTLGDPVFRGGVFIEEGLLQLPATGTTLRDINIAATSQGGDQLTLAGKLRAGEGSARVSGTVVLTESGGVVAELGLDGENLATVQLPQLSLASSPQLRVVVNDQGVDVSGRVLIPEAVARIRELPPEAARRAPDVVVHTDESGLDYEADEKVVTGNIELVLGDKVMFYGFGLETRLDGSLRLTQRPGRTLRGNGTVRTRDGFLTGYGKELRVDRGTLTFTGPLDDPVVDVQVSRQTTYENRRYTVGLRLSGTASNLKTEPFSRPAMSEQDVLAFLLLDRPASRSGEDTDLSGAVLAMGLGQMMPGDSGKFGLDEISFEGSELNQTAVVAGKRISEDLYIRYVFGLFGQPGQFRIRYRLGGGFSLEATTGGTSQALDLIYLIERE